MKEGGGGSKHAGHAREAPPCDPGILPTCKPQREPAVLARVHAGAASVALRHGGIWMSVVPLTL